MKHARDFEIFGLVGHAHNQKCTHSDEKVLKGVMSKHPCSNQLEFLALPGASSQQVCAICPQT